MPLGILDWGIGGLGFVRLLKERHPGVPVVYLSDAGEVPYGLLPASALSDRVARALAFLKHCGADYVVVACNAASTVLPRIADRIAKGVGDIDVSKLPHSTGVIPHGIESVAAEAGTMAGATVGVIGGGRTIRSGIYRRALEERGFVVRQRVAQRLSGHIERGHLASDELARDLQRILAPLHGVDFLLLACTHYAAIIPTISEHLPGTTIIDPIDRLLSWIEGCWELQQSATEDRYLTTGDPEAMRLSGEQAFGVALDRVETLDHSLSEH